MSKRARSACLLQSQPKEIGPVTKKYRGKICVYCCVSPSTTRDHVISRQFFLERRRSRLPIVPACEKCNFEKSKLEHYLTSVLPFGGRHDDALENLATMTPQRLEKNAKLLRKLSGSLKNVSTVIPEQGNSLVLQLDSEKVELLFELITRGLLWHHWGTLLTPADSCYAAVLTTSACKIYDETVFRAHARNHVKANLGSGTFCYEGKRSDDPPQLSLWKFSIYGELEFRGEARAEKSSCIRAVSGPQQFVDSVRRAFNN